MSSSNQPTNKQNDAMAWKSNASPYEDSFNVLWHY